MVTEVACVEEKIFILCLLFLRSRREWEARLVEYESLEKEVANALEKATKELSMMQSIPQVLINWQNEGTSVVMNMVSKIWFD